MSSDGCHTPVVKDFLGGGDVMQNLLGLRAELNQRICMSRQIRELKMSLGI